MKAKLIVPLILITSCNLLYSQLMITEVYVNTPFNEKLKFGNDTKGFVDAKKHHRGEFVEIYNYSDKEVNLRNWYLRDTQNGISLPDKIIKPGQFMVVAYTTLPAYTTIFPELFPSTVGKENQIIYQDGILLRNKIDRITLGYVLGYKGIDKSGFIWEWGVEPAPNYIPNLWTNPAGYYTIKSIQYHPDPMSTLDPNIQLGNRDIYNYTATPNPLAANYVPPTQSYDELVKNDFQEYYSFLDWTDNVNYLIDKQCPITIEKIFQTPSGSYSGNGSNCFTYDEAGNMIVSTNCGGTTQPPSSSGYTTDELEDIKNNINIYPNPTKASDQYLVTVTWSGVAINKINSLQVFNSTGLLVYSYIPGGTTTSFSLQNQLPGTFIANFTLTTGQVISKNILKW